MRQTETWFLFFFLKLEDEICLRFGEKRARFVLACFVLACLCPWKRVEMRKHFESRALQDANRLYLLETYMYTHMNHPDNCTLRTRANMLQYLSTGDH